MFCEKCGCANTDGAKFCIRCGASLASKGNSIEEQKSTAPIKKKEYFANHCSDVAQKNRNTIKILSAVSLAIQGILNLVFIIFFMILKNAVEQHPLYEGSTMGMFVPIILSLIFTFGSFTFTICGAKKNSTGLFITATIFAFIATMIGGLIFNLGLRWLVGLGVTAVYIIMTMLNHQNNSERKASTKSK